MSELDTMRIENIFDYAQDKKLKEGDSFEVVVIDINDRGQIKLSRKALLKPAHPSAHPAPHSHGKAPAHTSH